MSYGVRVQVSSTAPNNSGTITVVPLLLYPLITTMNKPVFFERMQFMYRLTVADANTTHHIDFIEKILLSDAIQKLKIDFDFPCSGNQTCGKCLVFASGALSKPGVNEQLFTHALGMRLACHTWAVGDAQIRIPEKPLNDSILSLGTMRFFEITTNNNDNFGIAIDIGTTTIVAGLFKPNASEPIAIVSERNRQNKYGADVISRISYSMEQIGRAHV